MNFLYYPFPNQVLLLLRDVYHGNSYPFTVYGLQLTVGKN